MPVFTVTEDAGVCVHFDDENKSEEICLDPPFRKDHVKAIFLHRNLPGKQ